MEENWDLIRLFIWLYNGFRRIFWESSWPALLVLPLLSFLGGRWPGCASDICLDGKSAESPPSGKDTNSSPSSGLCLDTRMTQWHTECFSRCVCCHHTTLIKS